MDLPAAPVKQGRHEEILEKVKMMNPGKTDMYVDLSTSIDGGRLMAGDGVCPCISTNHPVFSTRMDRYLTTGDFLNLQGFFQSAISESTRCELLANPGFALDLLGNSFTSTVCQAVLLSAFAVTPATWETVINRPRQASKSNSTDLIIRWRLRGKRKAEELYVRKAPVHEGPGPRRVGRPKYCRKGEYQRQMRQRGIVRNKKNKGKKESATIWDKEAVCQT